MRPHAFILGPIFSAAGLLILCGWFLALGATPTPPKIVRQTSPPTNAVRRATAYCTNGYQFKWSYNFTPPEFTAFRLDVRDTLAAPWKPWATNSRPAFAWYRTNGNKFMRCVAIDRDMARDSAGGLKR